MTCDTDAGIPVAPRASNVLIFVLDDVGVDKIGAYGVHPTPSTTPRLDALIDRGVRFDRAYASPSCSPTRASILTGRHASRHGIGEWISPWDDEYSLPDNERTLAEIASDAGWATAAVGKWHVSVYDGHDVTSDPQRQGFDHFRGTLGNPDMAIEGDGETRGYWHWERVDDGVLTFSDAYLTTAQADDTLDLVTTLPEPWVVYVGWSAAHSPLDSPPSTLARPLSDSDLDRYDAVVQALDTEIGRVLDGLGELAERTDVVTIGDNGTSADAVRAPWDADRAKLSMYEGGVRVPLSVSGPDVGEPGVSTALVHAVDVFATVAEVVGLDLATLRIPIDGASLLAYAQGPSLAGARRCVLAEHFEPDGSERRSVLDRAVITDDRKLIRRRHERDEVLSVGVDPSAETAVTDDEARQELRQELRRYERAL